MNHDRDGHSSSYVGSFTRISRYRHLFLAETREYIADYRATASSTQT